MSAGPSPSRALALAIVDMGESSAKLLLTSLYSADGDWGSEKRTVCGRAKVLHKVCRPPPRPSFRVLFSIYDHEVDVDPVILGTG